MPTAALASTASFATAEAAAADVSVATAAAYSTSGVTIADDAELWGILLSRQENQERRFMW
jgi:hypothetical protein